MGPKPFAGRVRSTRQPSAGATPVAHPDNRRGLTVFNGCAGGKRVKNLAGHDLTEKPCPSFILRDTITLGAAGVLCPAGRAQGMRSETHLVTFGLVSNLNDVNFFPHAGDEFSEAMWEL